MQLVDYSARPSSGPEVAAAGYQGAIRYLVNDPDRLPNKRLTPEEAHSFLALGMPLVSNWQKTKEDYLRGFDGGAYDAEEGLRWHYACGGPGFRPIYFSIDGDVNIDVWNDKCLSYLNGAASVLGHEWIGVYGGQRQMWWAGEDGFGWRWQTRAWSRYDANGNWNESLPVQWVSGCQLRQERIDEDHINDLGVDVNTTWADDFGQWQATGSDDYWKAIFEQQVGPQT